VGDKKGNVPITHFFPNHCHGHGEFALAHQPDFPETQRLDIFLSRNVYSCATQVCLLNTQILTTPVVSSQGLSVSTELPPLLLKKSVEMIFNHIFHHANYDFKKYEYP